MVTFLELLPYILMGTLVTLVLFSLGLKHHRDKVQSADWTEFCDYVDRIDQDEQLRWWRSDHTEHMKNLFFSRIDSVTLRDPVRENPYFIVWHAGRGRELLWDSRKFASKAAALW